jgi:hypothetical protein
MSRDDEELEEGNGASGSPLKWLLLVLVTVVAGFFGLKLLFGLLKTVLVLAAVGGVGYLGYRLVTNKLLPDDSEASKTREEPKLLEAEETTAPSSTLTPRPKARAEDQDEALAALKEAMRELDDLKKLRDE